MLRYGQIVKLTKPKSITINYRYKTLVNTLRKYYGGKICKSRPRAYDLSYWVRMEDCSVYRGTVPAGTLGVLSFSIISSEREAYSVFIQNPETKLTGQNLKLELGADDLTTDISVDEFKSIEKAQHKFMSSRLRIDNLNLVSRIEDVRHPGDKDEKV